MFNIDDDINHLEIIGNETERVLLELLEAHPQKKGSIFVIGCSSSEVAGGVIGKDSNEKIGQVIFEKAHKILKKKGLYIACQCCEHLNRALVVELECCEKWQLTEVSVVPWLHAGGAFATAAYHSLKKDACVVEDVKASAGIDIGGTLIGMHLKPVAVPFRFTQSHVGNGTVFGAWSRPKLIGGERAHYK